MSSNAFNALEREYNEREARLDEARATLRAFAAEMAARRAALLLPSDGRGLLSLESDHEVRSAVAAARFVRNP